LDACNISDRIVNALDLVMSVWLRPDERDLL